MVHIREGDGQQCTCYKGLFPWCDVQCHCVACFLLLFDETGNALHGFDKIIIWFHFAFDLWDDLVVDCWRYPEVAWGQGETLFCELQVPGMFRYLMRSERDFALDLMPKCLLCYSETGLKTELAVYSGIGLKYKRDSKILSRIQQIQGAEGQMP